MENLDNITLTGEQNEIYRQPFTGTILVKGAAGSGKTVVALKRAEHLLLNEEGRLDFGDVKKVCFTTFNKKLVVDIAEAMRSLSGLEVSSIDSLVYKILTQTFKYSYGAICVDIRQMSVAMREAKERMVRYARTTGVNSIVLSRDVTFLTEEIAYIKGLGIRDESAYLNLERRGRGSSAGVLRKDARRLIWHAYEDYNRILRAKGFMDFEDRVNLAVSMMEKTGFKGCVKHLVVDEAQDCTLQKLRFLKALVVEGGSLTLIADMAQRIYNVSFSWKDAGIMINRARSWELKRNHRNTLQIAKVGEAIRAGSSAKEEFTDIELPTREGPLPELVFGGRLNDIKNAVLGYVKAHPGMDTVVTTWRRSDVGEIKRFLDSRGVACEVDTIHALKGRSFKHVALVGISAEELPYADDEEENERRRNLLYVATTRATESLMLASVGEVTPFVRVLDGTLFNVHRLSTDGKDAAAIL